MSALRQVTDAPVEMVVAVEKDAERLEIVQRTHHVPYVFKEAHLRKVCDPFEAQRTQETLYTKRF